VGQLLNEKLLGLQHRRHVHQRKGLEGQELLMAKRILSGEQLLELSEFHIMRGSFRDKLQLEQQLGQLRGDRLLEPEQQPDMVPKQSIWPDLHMELQQLYGAGLLELRRGRLQPEPELRLGFTHKQRLVPADRMLFL